MTARKFRRQPFAFIRLYKAGARSSTSFIKE